MASINARNDTGKLYIDFRYRNIRCREQTELKDTPQNRRKLHLFVERIEAEILLGQFNYAATFPNSRVLKKLQKIDRHDSEAHVPTFQTFSNIWFDEMSIQWRESYRKTVDKLMTLRLLPHFGEYQLNQITKSQLLNFRAELKRTLKKNGDELAPSYVNRHMKILRSILSEASERYGFSTPYKGIKPLKVPRTDIKPFTPAEINMILQNVRQDFRDYYTVRFFTGLRTGEIDGLKWKYVDLETRLIYVRETRINGRDEYTKNDFSQRDVQMSQPVYLALRSMWKRTGNQEFVFVNNEGNPFIDNI